ncbi:hypothetical protein AB990_08760 [Alkalihalobacillus pseudalcaliphilus]|nr:hypothetical protein AB990_08760 [Alkalihalobacillus pseudalcaliphilus]
MKRDHPIHYVVNVNNESQPTHQYGVVTATVTHFTREIYLPRILVDIGVASSISEVRRNRPELVKELPKTPHFQRFKYGKRLVDIFVYA